MEECSHTGVRVECRHIRKVCTYFIDCYETRKQSLADRYASGLVHKGTTILGWQIIPARGYHEAMRLVTERSGDVLKDEEYTEFWTHTRSYDEAIRMMAMVDISYDSTIWLTPDQCMYISIWNTMMKNGEGLE